MQQQQANMERSDWGLFEMCGSTIPAKFRMGMRWEGEFADYAIKDAQNTGQSYMIQRAVRAPDAWAMRFGVTFPRGDRIPGTIHVVVVPEIVLPIMRDVIARIGAPVCVTVNELEMAGDFRPSLDLLGLLRGLNVESIIVQNMTVIAHPPPRDEPSWALHPLRRLCMSNCKFTDFGWARLADLARRCRLQIFELNSCIHSSARGNFLRRNNMLNAISCGRNIIRLSTFENKDAARPYLEPGRIIQATAPLPNLRCLCIESHNFMLSDENACGICRALRVRRARPLEDLELRFKFTDAGLASIIDAASEQDNVAGLHIPHLPAGDLTALALARAAMRNNGMSFFSYFIPGTSHWTSRVRLINALVLSTHMEHSIYVPETRKATEGPYVRFVTEGHRWRNPICYIDSKLRSFHDSTRYGPDSPCRYRSCKLIHGVDSTALLGIFESMPEDTEAVAVGNTDVTWDYLAALVRARPLLRAIALMKCAVVL